MSRAISLFTAAAVTAGLALTITAASAAPAPSPEMQPSIVGGHAPTQPWPDGAKIFITYDAPEYGVYDRPHCGATQYSGHLLKTAAHCETPTPDEANPTTRAAFVNRYMADELAAKVPFKARHFKARIGSDDRTSGGIVVDITPFWHDPQWSWGQNPGDSADAGLFFSAQYIDTYALPIAPRAVRPGETVYQLGWGSTEPNGKGALPTKIRELKTTVLPTRSCAPVITGREVCVKNPGGVSGPCHGDSGSPLGVKIDGVMYDAGIVSQGLSPIDACGDTPGIFTSTPEYAKDLAKAAIGAPAARPAVTTGTGQVIGIPVR